MTTAYFQDRAPIQQTRKLADGRLAAVARFARAGVYKYSGREVDPNNEHGLRDQASVNVYRAENEVFSEASMASFAHKAMTLDHPPESVTADNWSKYSVGYTEGRVARDGGFVTIPLILADAAAVRAYESGKARELSAGYSCSLVFGDGVAPDGTPYQARQVNIRANHLAVVSAGRAGPECRIGDSAMHMITDADRPALQAHIAFERNKYELGQAHRGSAAAPWTDAMAQAATQRFIDGRARGPAPAIGSPGPIACADRSAFVTDEASLATERVRAEAAYAKSRAYLNDWRKGA